MLAQSASLARDTGLAFDLCQGDVHRLPFPSGAFDLVTCRRAAHHFADLGLALREVRRALRPGGRLVIDDRSVPEDEAVAALMNRLDVLHDPSHVREYPPSVWRAMLTEAGFDVDHLETYDRLRPLRDLTAGATPAAVGEIQQLVEGMEPAAAEAFGRVRRDGEWQVRHWFVLLGARS
jgi:SAM-dependent methyltransferase